MKSAQVRLYRSVRNAHSVKRDPDGPITLRCSAAKGQVSEANMKSAQRSLYVSVRNTHSVKRDPDGPINLSEQITAARAWR